MNKVFFLDNDGVICLSNNWGGRFKKENKWLRDNDYRPGTAPDVPIEFRFDDFDNKAVKVLNEILEKTGADIVVSSDWKLHATLEELCTYYKLHGVRTTPIDTTDKVLHNNYDNFPWYRSARLEQVRSLEIKEWLEKHPEVTHWVAVDDLNMSEHTINHPQLGEAPWGLKNFVHTPLSNEGIKQSGVKDKILKFLLD